ncbi:MAG: Gfo/Idh/MocA family oxidoreductase [Bacteroidetes bacterium]|nr:Gfo/Idh/MocA family oxidoreductase [Bacteroidota bacterium]
MRSKLDNVLAKTPRRRFLKTSALGLSAVAISPSILAGIHETKLPDEEKLGVALVGLSWYGTDFIATAFEHSKYCKLTGFVTGKPDADKAKDFQKKYDIKDKNIYSYDSFDEMADNPDIDMVYIVLPNGLHADFTIRAAKAGKHVICEKPMEVSVERGQSMIDACKNAGRLLQIGYRCQFDPYHREIMRLSREKVFGEVKLIQTSFSFFGVNSDNWRFTNKELSGGGPMMDIGVYCIQGARYTMGVEPVAITARTYKTYMDKLPDMEETAVWEMEFPNGAIVSCVSSYVGRDDYIHVSAEKGSFGLRPCYNADPQGLPEGYFNDQKMNFPRQNQQAVQLDAFARNILDGTPVIASGEDGLQDLRIIEAIYKAAKTGERIEL